MGIWISAGLFALLEWSLEVSRIGGVALCLCGVALFLRHGVAVRRRQVRDGSPGTVPWAALTTSGIGLFVLAVASVALFVGNRTGVFPA